MHYIPPCDPTTPLSSSDAPERPLLIVLAGPNGAGKSTFFDHVLKPSALAFVNADLIVQAHAAQGQILGAYEAAQLAQQERALRLAKGESFVMETVFSDTQKAKLGFLQQAKDAGYDVFLNFIGLSNVATSIARVTQRVAAGGHDVPDDKLLARYPRTIGNLRQAFNIADQVWIYDNSTLRHPYRLIAHLRQGKVTTLAHELPSWCRPLGLRRRVNAATLVMFEDDAGP